MVGILEFYFRFPYWPMCSYRSVILHLPAEFRSNRTNGGEVMTSYRFFKTAAIECEIYFRVQVLWLHSFKVEIYLHIKFRWNISIHRWYKTASVFGIRTTAILEFHFRFKFSPNIRYQRVIPHRPTKFCQNGATLGAVMTSYPFFKMAAESHIGSDLGNIIPTTKCNWWSKCGPQIGCRLD